MRYDGRLSWWQMLARRFGVNAETELDERDFPRMKNKELIDHVRAQQQVIDAQLYLLDEAKKELASRGIDPDIFY